MRRFNPPPVSERFTTFWHGNVAGTTWAHRNISSVTENGLADVTLTFQQAYVATPSVILGAGESASTLQGAVSAISASSVRVITRNGSNTAVVARKTGVIVTGDF